MRRLLLIAIGVIWLCSPAFSASWVVFDVDRDFHSYHNPVIGSGQIVYTLEHGQLTLDPDRVDTVGGSSAYHWSLLFSGQWAVLGTIGANIFTPDPYASFVETGTGEGYVSWNVATPAGYTTTLILGGSFVGDGASAYQEQNVYPADTVTGTLVLHRMFMGGMGHEYELRSHSFAVTYQAVPEPSSIALLATGLAGFAAVWRRRRNM